MTEGSPLQDCVTRASRQDHQQHDRKSCDVETGRGEVLAKNMGPVVRQCADIPYGHWGGWWAKGAWGSVNDVATTTQKHSHKNIQ